MQWISVEWVTVIDGVNFEFHDISRGLYHCIQKSVLSGDGLSVYIKYIFHVMFLGIAITVIYFGSNIKIG